MPMKIRVTPIGCIQSPHWKAAMRTAGIQQMRIPMYGIMVSTTTIAPITAAKFRPNSVKAVPIRMPSTRQTSS